MWTDNLQSIATIIFHNFLNGSRYITGYIRLIYPFRDILRACVLRSPCNSDILDINIRWYTNYLLRMLHFH